MKAPYTPAEKKKALARIAKGESRASVARAMHIDPTTLKRWQKEAASPAEARPVTPQDLITIGDTSAESGPLQDIGPLRTLLATTMPTTTPEEVYRAAMVQKILAAVEKSDIPQLHKISDWKSIIALLNQMMLPTGGPKKGGGSQTLTIRFDRLSGGPRGSVQEAEIVGDEK